MIAALDAEQAKSSDILIYPNMDSIPLLAKDPVLLKKGVDIGEAATDRKMSAITQSLAAARDDSQADRSSASAGSSQIAFS